MSEPQKITRLNHNGVKDSANIDGNIYSPTVSLIEGANFNGTIEMRKKRAEAPAEAPRSAAEAPDARPSRAASGSK